MQDLWGFDKLSKHDLKSLPQGILKEQADLFDNKTDGKLYIRIATRNLTRKAGDMFGLATNFDIIAPFLDNYSYTLFTMYSMPEKDYPVAISTNSEDFDPIFSTFEHECDNEASFLKVLKEILGNQETSNIIKNLYSKSFIDNDY
ncbi:hypothetical protein ABE073_02840 [Lederbergia citrisecunda]|uniref:hypothetical protein n=1 Tax=Lederbergia citrisecunda TaxID=2833583 RepID=UPI003D2BA1F0